MSPVLQRWTRRVLIGLGAVIGALACVALLIVVAMSFFPATMHKVVVRGGGHRIEQATVVVCRNEYPIDVTDRGAEGEFHDEADCYSNLKVRVKTPSAMYTCSADYDFIFPQLYSFSLVDGLCEGQGEDRDRRELRYHPIMF